MISIRKYLDGSATPTPARSAVASTSPSASSFLLESYRALLRCFGHSCVDACPPEGAPLEARLTELAEAFTPQAAPQSLDVAHVTVQREVEAWGHRTARHYQRTASEVKQLLLTMARTADSVAQRDQHCAAKVDQVTRKLRSIATLEDITLIRSSIEQSASELKQSIDRLNAEGKASLNALQSEVTAFKVKLEQAEEVASRDALTGLRSRLFIESHIENRIAVSTPFCVALLDLDGFKQVNDEYGHLAGDELLKQFANELRSACRTGDIVGRWGGDEFLVVLECAQQEAQSRMERVRAWVCGDYNLQAPSLKLHVSASIGLAASQPAENMTELLARADAAMYAEKAARPDRPVRRTTP